MAEPKPDHVYTENLRVLEKIMGVMFNNIKFSDTVFTVKEQKYYALSQLLAASSETMNTLISTHYEHCQDRDIKLYDIRNEESFMIILQYIYGMNINFSQMNITVMCEVLTLSEKYNLDDFFKDLKCFLSKMDCFQLDSIVSLLNTASKYNISELYKRVTVFAYENTEELVKHETFQDLQYNVLVDLIKSDWFCCSEIDILTGVLTWHTDMYDENKKKKKTIQNVNIASEEHNYYASSDKMDVSEGTGLAYVQEEIINMEDFNLNGEHENLNIEDSNLKEKDESLSADDPNKIQSTIFDKSNKCNGTLKSLCENVEEEIMNMEDFDLNGEHENFNIEDSNLKEKDESLNADDYKEIQSTMSEKCKETVKSFCENVLKSLLEYIRLSEISVEVWMTSYNTDWFKKYSDYLQNKDNFSKISKPRQKYATVTSRNVACVNVPDTVMLKYNYTKSLIGRIQNHRIFLTNHELQRKCFILNLLKIAGVSVLEWDSIHFETISFLFSTDQQFHWMVSLKITPTGIFAKLRSIFNSAEVLLHFPSLPAGRGKIFAYLLLLSLSSRLVSEGKAHQIHQGMVRQICEEIHQGMVGQICEVGQQTKTIVLPDWLIGT